MTVGERIKAKRLEIGMSQEELAFKCGYKSRSSINKIELARNLPLKKVELVAKQLGVTPAYLMGWENIESVHDKNNYRGTYYDYIEDASKNCCMVRESPSFYGTDETREIAQQIFENKDLSLLFDAAKDASPEDLQTVHTMLLALKNKEKK